MASAIKTGYKPLSESREYFYKLEDKELLSLIVEVTGAEPSSSTAKQILYTLNALKEYADFDAANATPESGTSISQDQHFQLPRAPEPRTAGDALGLNLAYTINLNLPATSDQSVFNAIFKSLKEHLLSYGE